MDPMILTAELEKAICQYATELWGLCESGEHNQRSFTTEARLRLYELSSYVRFLTTAKVKITMDTEEFR